MTSLSLRQVSRSFGERVALQGITLDVSPGEFFSILGPSGCGKTTLLRIIAGFERPDTGAVVLSESDVTHVAPEEREIGMVFQNYALFPHMNVFDNVAFGLRVRRTPNPELRHRVEAALASVALGGREREPVNALSGGEQQRVAVARALVIHPRLLLFDEPLSNLDASLRQQTREEIRAIQKKTSITSIYVTHDQAEAMSLSDRLAIMRAGTIEQIGTPQEIYESPATPFVARFLGWGNVMQGTLRPEGLAVGSTVFPIPPAIIKRAAGPVVAAIPPDAVTVVSEHVHEAIAATVLELEYLGIAIGVTAGAGNVSIKASLVRPERSVHVGDTVHLSIDWSRGRFYPAEET